MRTDATFLGDVAVLDGTVSDDSLPTLLKFQTLTNLNVSGTLLGDDSFRELAKLPNLTRLDVSNTSIGFDVVDEITEANPNLNLIE